MKTAIYNMDWRPIAILEVSEKAMRRAMQGSRSLRMRLMPARSARPEHDFSSALAGWDVELFFEELSMANCRVDICLRTDSRALEELLTEPRRRPGYRALKSYDQHQLDAAYDRQVSSIERALGAACR